ncbi:hypothetical protein VLJ47_001969 [Escherichia coli]|nr:hypothetical protein [Escherichia coli]
MNRLGRYFAIFIQQMDLDPAQRVTIVWGSVQFWAELVQPGRTGKPCVARGVVI